MTTLHLPLRKMRSLLVRVGEVRQCGTQRGLIGVALAALLIVTTMVAPAAPVYAAPAGTIAVTTTADEFNTGAGCSLREAVQSANTNTNFGGCFRFGTTPYRIDLGAGTYTLTRSGADEDANATGDIDILANFTIILGAGAASTTIQQTTADRVLDFNPSGLSNFSAWLYDLRLTGGNVSSNFGGGALLYGDSNGGGLLTLEGVTIDNNTASGGPGGGIAVSPLGTLEITGSTISNNTASSTTSGQGGGIDFFVLGGINYLQIINSTISGNRAAYIGDAGGGLNISGGSALISHTHLVNNRAANGALVPTGSGGAIAHQGGTLTVAYSRFVGNVATSGSGIFQVAGGGTTDANYNWWGINTGPGPGVLAGTPAPTATYWLQLRHIADPASVPANTATTLTATLLGLNTGGFCGGCSLAGLPAFPEPAATIFSNPVLGTLSGAATQLTDGQATATYTAGLSAGAGSADATVDSQTVTVPINLTPLAVTLAGFSAEAQADGVLVSWETVSEVDNLGFNLWRGTSPDGPDTRLNASLIPSQSPGSAQGHSYEWIDQANLAAGVTYYYWLEDVDASGSVTRHGPVSTIFSAPTAVTLGELSASPAASGSAAWGVPALLAALGAAATLASRRRR